MASAATAAINDGSRGERESSKRERERRRQWRRRLLRFRLRRRRVWIVPVTFQVSVQSAWVARVRVWIWASVQLLVSGSSPVRLQSTPVIIRFG
ncbi:hypothetical protein HanIR_Chr05g0221761 [Helianthus annuus]|nr:hypothetical protein HanIR_Chr05g0221761 [Helianthus annuus]